MLDVGCFPIPQNWLVLNSGAGGAVFNMALDEALLEAMPRLQKPVLRFYGWTEPAATFGYFQKFSEVERATHLRPLIRRPTGGGIVPHEADWTYSVVFPPGHEWHSLKAEESYRRIHDWLRLAFAELKAETELAPCRRKAEIPGACFVGHEKSDLLWRGKKIAGAAQRRHQGAPQRRPLAHLRPADVGKEIGDDDHRHAEPAAQPADERARQVDERIRHAAAFHHGAGEDEARDRQEDPVLRCADEAGREHF